MDRTLGRSQVLRDQHEILDDRLVLEVGFVLDRAPKLTFVLTHIGFVRRRTGHLHVVRHDQPARAQPTLPQNQL